MPSRPPESTRPTQPTEVAAWAAVAQCLDGSATSPTPKTLAKKCALSLAELEALCQRHRQRDAAATLREHCLERAQARLLDDSISISAIADDSGLDGEQALDKLMLGALGMSANAYRQAPTRSEMTLRLPKDFRLEETFRYLGRDPHSLTLRVAGSSFAVALRCANKAVRVDAMISGSSVNVRVVSRGKRPANANTAAITAVAHLLGLGTQTAQFERRARAEPDIARLVADRTGMRIGRTVSAFDAMVWSIIGQQISLPFAYQLTNALAELAGAAAPGGMHAMPPPTAIANLDAETLTAQKFSRAKAAYVLGTSRAVLDDSLPLDTLGRCSALEASARLLAQKGLGPWSVNYIMMRGLGFPDCAPIGDAGLRRALGAFNDCPERLTDGEMEMLMQPFAPHRSLATFHLWRSLDPHNVI
ncbi:MAG: AraC family transcriptional regulator of adaptative response / DNA-3-methyladenine glycosylase II [Gammaproteobacteria bacterium]|jgi:AraC family transcriptional regulator of adaptative response / DNA-3-methyladenine glycosylase II